MERLLWESKPRPGWRPDKWPAVQVAFEQYPAVDWANNGKGFDNMRTVFVIELKADISSVDEERRKAFIDLAMETAKALYGQAAMVSQKAPTITLNEVGAAGKVNHPVFPGEGDPPA